MNIAEVLQARARERGEAAAIVEPRRQITFAALEVLAARIAADLVAAGLRPGDRALVVCPMSIALYAVLVGLWRMGGVAVIVDPSAGDDHIAACCRRTPPHAFIAVRRAHLLRLVSPAVRAVPIAIALDGWAPGARTIVVDAEPTVGSGSGTIAPADAETPALITFTSGSTGVPKAAVRSHGFLLAQHRVLADDLRLQPGQRDLATLPIFVLANLASGVTSVIPDADLRQPGAIAPAPVLRQIEAAGVTRVAASPALLDRLARHANALSSYVSPLAEIYTGGAPVFPPGLRRLHAMAPQARLVAVYGSTEAEPIATVEWSEIGEVEWRAMEAGAGLLAGRPVHAIELKIIPDRWGEPLGPFAPQAFDGLARGPSQPGEIVVTGAHVLSGYLGGIGNTETKIVVGERAWHRTGDAGYLDARGRLWLLGRCSARMTDGADALYPFAVECAALTVDGVERTALVEHGARRLLVVELARGAASTTADALGERLAFARLDQVVIVTSIPLDRRHNAKVDYPALRRLLDHQRA
jgi:acyl-CoA synthetase (AMP-forming)/AMP-acid ligase II